jgi:hypothetical protein
MVMQELLSIFDAGVSLHAWLQLCKDVQKYFLSTLSFLSQYFFLTCMADHANTKIKKVRPYTVPAV